jgi:alkylation response protein AidB-like acyl-CoA dehydrogenase
MMLTQTEEQKMLEESVSSLLASNSGGSQWREFAEMGLLAMPFDAKDGGLCSSPADLMLVMGLLGKTQSPEPFLASAIIGARLLNTLASADQKAELLAGVMDGRIRLALAHAEPGARYELGQVSLTATLADGGYRMSGLKTLVAGGASATHLLVSACDQNGISLFVIPVSTGGVQITAYANKIDADVQLTDVFVPLSGLLGHRGGALEAIEEAVDHALAALAAEAVGAMERLLALTLDYLRVRKQFGVPLSSFQALQHKAVDMFVEIEQAKSMATYAASMLTAPRDERHMAVAAAKAHVNAAARFVGETGVQLHGALGLTMESAAGRLFRRLTEIQLAFADRDHCLRVLSRSAASILEV